MRLLLDTNAYSALGRGEARITALAREAKELLMSVVVIGELLAGFRQGSRFDSNLEELRRLLASPRVQLAPVTWATANRYALLLVALRRRGTPIPTNDLWIAAQALESGAELVSADHHFGLVDGLAWIDTRR